MPSGLASRLLPALALLTAIGCNSPSMLAREVTSSKAEWTVTVLGLDTQPDSWEADVPRRSYDGSGETGRKLIWLRCSIENNSPFKRAIPLGYSVLELEGESATPHFIRAPKPFFQSLGVAGLYLRAPQSAPLNSVLECFEVDGGSSKEYLIAYRVESRRSVPRAWTVPCPSAPSWEDWNEIRRRQSEDYELRLELPLAGYS